MNRNSLCMDNTLKNNLLDKPNILQHICDVPKLNFSCFSPNIFAITPTVGEVSNHDAILLWMTQADINFYITVVINGGEHPHSINILSKKYEISTFKIDLFMLSSSYEIRWHRNGNYIGSNTFNNNNPTKIVIVSNNYSSNSSKISNYNYINGMNPDILIHAGGNVYADNITNNKSLILNRYRTSLNASESIRGITSNLMIGNNHDKNNNRGYYNGIQNSLHFQLIDNNQWIKFYDNIAILGIEYITDYKLNNILCNLSKNISKIIIVLSRCYMVEVTNKCSNRLFNIGLSLLENSDRGSFSNKLSDVTLPLLDWMEKNIINECAIVCGGGTIAFNGKAIRKSEHSHYVIPIVACGPISMDRGIYDSMQDYLLSSNIVGTYNISDTDTIIIENSNMFSSICTIEIDNNGLCIKHYDIAPTS